MALEGLLSRIGGYIGGGGVTEGTNPPADMNNLKQPVNNVSSLENDSDYNQMAQLWGEHYQTEQDPTKMNKFQQEMSAEENPEIRNIVNQMGDVYSQQETGMSPEDFSNLLYHTGFHESGAIGGTPRATQGYLNDAGEWVSEGPAASYWQVEPSTLKDLVTATHASGASNPTTAYWGPKATEATGFSAEQLYNMDEDELYNLLQENPILGAVGAGGKYVKSFKANPVQSVMDNNNRVEDAFNY